MNSRQVKLLPVIRPYLPFEINAQTPLLWLLLHNLVYLFTFWTFC